MATPDSILSQAISRRDTALAEADRWRQFIEMYEEIHGGKKLHRDVGTYMVTRHEGAIVSAAGPIERAMGAIADTQAAALKILRRERRHMPTRELLQLVTAEGVHVGGLDPVATLSARLSRAPMLVNERPFGWRAKEFPEGNEATGDLLSSDAPVAPDTQPQGPAAPDGGGT